MCFSTNCSRVWGKIVPVITREQHVYISSFLAKKDYTNKKEKRETVSARRVSPGHVFHAFVFLTRWAHFQNVSLLKIGKKKPFDAAECTSYLSRVAKYLPRTLPNKLARSRSDLRWRHAALVYSVHLWY